MRNSQPTMTGSIGMQRGSPFGSEPWTPEHDAIVVDGLRHRLPYHAIARILREAENGRRRANGQNVYLHVTEHGWHGAVERFLREHGVQDPMEIMEISEVYASTNGGEPFPDKKLQMIAEGKEMGKPVFIPPPRIMRNDVLGERAAIEKIIKDGILRRESFATMVDRATEQMIPLTIPQIERKLFRSCDGVASFLEHMGLSQNAAKAHEEAYNKAKK